MIGSHNSFTYKSPENPIFKLFSFLWKTQNLSLTEQYEKGVRFFDIRFRYTKNKTLQPCHGIVDLGPGRFPSLYHLVTHLHKLLPKAEFRIFLERGNEEDRNLFRKESYDVIHFPYLKMLAIKSPWEIIKKGNIIIKDYTYNPFDSGKSLLENLKNWKPSTIKKNAKHNPKITKDLINNTTIYFMDMIDSEFNFDEEPIYDEEEYDWY